MLIEPKCNCYKCKWYHGVKWAEVCFVPNAIGHSKKGVEYRYPTKREVLVEQRVLPDLEQQLRLPFPTIELIKRQKV